MSQSIATVARDQLRALAALLKTAWSVKQAQVLVKQFAALAELANERHLTELSTLSRALSATVLLYVKAGPDKAGQERFMDLGRKLNALLNQYESNAEGPKSATPDKPAPTEIKIQAHFRPVYWLTDTDPAQISVPPRELMMALAEREFALQFFADGDDFSDALAKEVPSVVMCEAALMPALSELLDNIEKEQPGVSTRIALLAVSKSASAARRLTAALGWADVYLEAPNAMQIAEQIVELATPKNEAPYQILIVDDDRQQAMFCAGVLKRKGMEVKSALSAEEALNVLTTMRPDLVLMDLYLPGLNGMELTAILRERSDSLLLPIVFLSGEQDAQKRFDALNIGGDDYLTKPIRPRHLATAVASRVKRVRALRAQLSEARAPKDNQGLYRRSAFIEMLQSQAESAGGGQALLYLSIDNAPQLLEELGVLEQNALEQTVTARLTTVSDPADAITALGNFEYAVITRRTGSDRTVRQADSLRQSICAETFKFAGDELLLTLSVGVSDHAEARGGAERWLTLAQMSVQRAQRHGGNRVERGLIDALQTAAARSQVIEGMVKESFGRSNTLIEYQPLVPIHGAPVIQYAQHLRLRGNTVATSQIARTDYQSAAERIGTMGKIDRYAAQQAIATLREGGRAAASTRIVIRCAVSSLFDDLVQMLKTELASNQISANQLCVEFDTSEVELDAAVALRKIDALRGLGLSIAAYVSLWRPRTKSILQKMKPDLASVHAGLIDASNRHSLNVLAQIHDAVSTVQLCVTELSSPNSLETMWTLRVGYVIAEFLGPTRTQLDFNFTSGKRPKAA